ncbi:MAG: complex I subunit 5 family protein [Endomicrobia bacterium]|nr:complex I subunit 5 family protein [Endomicrobiia bacterium]MCL2799249.1 complex I subunit 5 family protein [Endomicrobiia bacterium]
MINMITLYFILIPLFCAAVLFLTPEKYKEFKRNFFVISALFNLFAVCFYFGKTVFSYYDWTGFNFSFSLVMSGFKEFMLIIPAFFAVLTSIFALSNMKENPRASLFNASMMIAVACVNGALITDSLIFLLLFIEALAIPFVLMIISSENDNKKLAIKAFAITAVADLFLMAGIAITYSIARTMNISEISLELSGFSQIAAFVFIVIGAAGKLGVMPFHSWMPEASEKTSVPFMVFMATAAEKVLGVYLFIVALNMFDAAPCKTTLILMCFAALSAVVAALLANSQKSFKRMLIYTSVSQGSFMAAALLSGIPLAIAGAVLHLLAHTVYKSSLFFGAGIMDDTKSETISYKNNPYIFTCFILTIASFIGVPFFAAFYSKELIYDGVLHLNIILYAVMIIVTFLCSSAVLNWFGKIFFSKDGEYVEYPVASMIPAVTAALLCLLLGVFKNIPSHIIENMIIPFGFQEHTHVLLIVISISALVIVLLNFIIGFSRYKNGLGFVSGLISAFRIDKLDAADDADPYNIVLKLYKSFGKASFDFDKGLNWIYDVLIVKTVLELSFIFKKVHNGSLRQYILWTLCGIAVIILFFV